MFSNIYLYNNLNLVYKKYLISQEFNSSKEVKNKRKKEKNKKNKTLIKKKNKFYIFEVSYMHLKSFSKHFFFPI